VVSNVAVTPTRPPDTALLTLGVEEEFQVVDARTGALASRAEELLEELTARGLPAGLGTVVMELPLSQVETVTGVCASLGEVRAAVSGLRAHLSDAAAARGLGLLASASPPVGDPAEQRVATAERYAPIVARAAQLAREQFIAGMHVHVGIGSRDLRAAVVDGLRAWLPVLTALSANSPYWFGTDTGFASYRTVHWRRWPVTGPPPRTGDAAGWDAAVAALIAAGAIPDASFAYWDVRVALRHPTVEVRCADVLISVEEVVALAGLVRGLAATILADVAAGREPLDSPEGVLRYASWHAGRYGLDADLVHPRTGALVPAHSVVADLVDLVQPALERHGDAAEVTAAVARTLSAGNGAQRQRAAHGRGGLPSVVAELTVRS
jgi:carboxylate-amine ligase